MLSKCLKAHCQTMYMHLDSSYNPTPVPNQLLAKIYETILMPSLTSLAMSEYCYYYYY